MLVVSLQNQFLHMFLKKVVVVVVKTSSLLSFLKQCLGFSIDVLTFGYFHSNNSFLCQLNFMIIRLSPV